MTGKYNLYCKIWQKISDYFSNSPTQQHLPVLGQRPKFVVHEHLQFIGDLAYFMHIRQDTSTIGFCTLCHVSYLVGQTPLLYHIMHVLAQRVHIAGYLLYHPQLGGAHLPHTLWSEEVLEAPAVLYQGVLELDGRGHDMVDYQVSQYPRLDLQLLGVGLLLHLVAGVELPVGQDAQ